MSIRVRLVWMCLVVALLPAVPLTFLVKSLLDKSFDVGLNPKFENALSSGLAVSRERLDDIRAGFHLNVQRVADAIGEDQPDSAAAAGVMARVVGASGAVHGLVVSRVPATGRAGTGDDAVSVLPRELQPFAGKAVLAQLIEGTGVLGRQDGRGTVYSFFDMENRSAFLAVWNPAGAPVPYGNANREGRAYRILFHKRVDPEFIADAERLIEGRQLFATLKLTQRSLAESFFLPFIIIYAVCLLLALGLALLIAERLAAPIRQLARGADTAADGDWDYRLDTKVGGETGRLVSAFNAMVARLDSQRRRLTDMEKMATWRDMARHLAHEIKNPLLPIRLTVEELRDQYKGDDAIYKEMLEDSARVVGDELGSLQKLVKEFSSFAKMPGMNAQPGSLCGLVRDVTQMYSRVETTVDAASDVPEFAFDADQIRRVLVNLFDNAVSVGSTHVRITLAHDEDEVTTTFSDNGPGIAPEHLDKIFEPYFTTREEGTGLGLAMVKKIVLLHGGSITAASPQGQGVTFEVRLPLASRAAAAANGGGENASI